VGWNGWTINLIIEMPQLETLENLVVQLPGPRISILVLGSGLLLALQFAACSGEITTQGYDGNSGAIAAAGSAVIPGGAGSGGSAGSGGTAGGGGTGGSGSGRGGSVSGTGGSSGSGSGRCNAPAILVNGDKCGGSGNPGCHGSGSPQGNFAESETALRGYVDEVSLEGSGCGLLIDSGNPEDSVLLQMVQGTQGPDCYPLPMPLQPYDPLSAEDQACLADWLTQF